MKRATRDRSFVVLMVGSLVLLGVVLSPFLYIFAIASTLSVVTWPVHTWLLERVGDRPRLAAFGMTVGVLLLIAIPVAGIVALGVSEAVQAAERAVLFMSTGGLDVWGASMEEAYERIRLDALSNILPTPEQLLESVEQMLLDFTRTVSSGIPGMLGALGRVAMDVLVFCIALYTCYLQGPDILRAVRNLSPLRAEYDDRLFEVSQQLARNIALGMVATAAAQGLVSAVGFWLADVPAVVALGLLTAVASLVPVFGSALVFVPVVVGLLLGEHYGSALFVLLWSMGLTASVDNVIRPLLLRTQLHISPLWLLLALLGGLLVMGPQGLVFGPFILVCCITLYTLYVRDFLDESDRDR